MQLCLGRLSSDFRKIPSPRGWRLPGNGNIPKIPPGAFGQASQGCTGWDFGGSGWILWVHPSSGYSVILWSFPPPSFPSDFSPPWAQIQHLEGRNSLTSPQKRQKMRKILEEEQLFPKKKGFKGATASPYPKRGKKWGKFWRRNSSFLKKGIQGSNSLTLSKRGKKSAKFWRRKRSFLKKRDPRRQQPNPIQKIRKFWRRNSCLGLQCKT